MKLLPLFQPRSGQTGAMLVLAFLRVAFIPLFMLCNISPPPHKSRNLPILLNNDAWPAVLTVALGLTNGYIGSLCMRYAPEWVVCVLLPWLYISVSLFLFSLFHCSLCVSLCLCLCLSVFVSVSISVSVCLCLCLSVCLSLSLSLCLPLFVSLSLSLSVCLSVCLSLLLLWTKFSLSWYVMVSLLDTMIWHLFERPWPSFMVTCIFLQSSLSIQIKLCMLFRLVVLIKVIVVYKWPPFWPSG